LSSSAASLRRNRRTGNSDGWFKDGNEMAVGSTRGMDFDGPIKLSASNLSSGKRTSNLPTYILLSNSTDYLFRGILFLQLPLCIY
jgi:hypothetical protein